ncbi:hypothetical protein [Pseudonocardia sp. 73-21]|uniref:hypothetical protein n=1 Tax=Pseudonocardia sp. 73-21 TaxID=1895809 RepID=UPI000967C741|nr:hypothetical protein [Pseudonocardia sp. 73-21]OJY38453.1 MAG: hypothetical protein BGP03_12955 [Pseudonocardia sp. 73-21]
MRRYLGTVPAATLVVLLGVTGCSSGTAPQDAASVVARLGAVPVPTAPPVAPVERADAGHPQVLAIGEPLDATVVGGAARVTMLGPDITPAASTSGPPESGSAVFTVLVSAGSGSVAIAATDLSGRDDHGRDLVLAPVGPATVASAPGTAPATLRVAAEVHAGAAQITWRHAGKALALWTFNVELD